MISSRGCSDTTDPSWHCTSYVPDQQENVMFNLVPHGICLSSSPGIIALLVAANFGIVLAYFAIPAILAILLFRHRIPMPTIITLFCVFIAGCGASHAMDIVTMYVGGNWYWVQVVVLAITAVASLTTSAVLMDVLLHLDKWIPRGG
jgi:two-component system NtrC family sensor kinase